MTPDDIPDFPAEFAGILDQIRVQVDQTTALIPDTWSRTSIVTFGMINWLEGMATILMMPNSSAGLPPEFAQRVWNEPQLREMGAILCRAIVIALVDDLKTAPTPPPA